MSDTSRAAMWHASGGPATVVGHCSALAASPAAGTSASKDLICSSACPAKAVLNSILWRSHNNTLTRSTMVTDTGATICKRETDVL